MPQTLKPAMIDKENTELDASGSELTHARTQEFLSLYQEDRRRLYAYIFTIVGDSTAADDIFQESSMVLWREFDKFQSGTNFSKWANAIAYNRIREHWARNKKHKKYFDDSQAEQLAERVVDMKQELDSRWDTLQSCVKKLRDVDQSLFKDFYTNQLTAQQLSDKVGRSIFAIRKSIHKIRKRLFECVDKNRKTD